MTRPYLRWGALILALAATVAATTVGAVVANGDARSTMVFVVPHPDDEFQFWSMIEHRPHQYDVVLLMTRGEETGFCEPNGLEAGWQPDLEPAPVVIPDGRWTESCERSRLASYEQYFVDMAETDPTLPGRFGEPERVGPFPDPDGVVCRIDDGGPCRSERAATVLHDLDGRGALVGFDLGDGDLTAAEVAWAVSAVLSDPGAVGIPADAPVRGIVGAYSSNLPVVCARYPHPDHAAVREALWTVDFGHGPQLGATCGMDFAARMFRAVSWASTDAAFEVHETEHGAERVGAHSANYGWLHGSYYPVSWWNQSTLFHRPQSFWVRYW